MDIFEKCFKFTRAQETIQAGIYPYFVPLSGNDGPVVHMDGKEVIMIGSNNYLGLTHDSRVIETAIEATRKYGTSCSGSRFLNGTLDLHIELEEKIAQFFNREATLIFSTGYMANLGSIATLVDRNDCILMDKSDHASIYAGVLYVNGACIRRYLHNNMHSLEKMIAELEPDKAKIIISDGVFSMEGDIVQLDELIKVAKKYNARVYLDEAHGLGVLGEHGRGSAEHLGLESEVDLIMSTFSKSLASLGGFITGSKAVIDYIKHKASPLIFSASPTPAATATVLKTLDIIKNEPEHMRRLSDVSKKMRRELKLLGFDIGISKDTPIIPIYIRNDEKTFIFWRQLFDNGVFANAVISPAVAPDEALIRTSFMSTHSDEHLDKVLSIVEKVAKNLGII